MNYYITTPIYYVNGDPHIGHFYCNLMSDCFGRMQKLLGNNVTLLTGTDEHGQKVQRSAEKNGYTPQAFCDYVSNKFRQMSIDFDFLFAENNFNNGKNFIRTTDTKHKNFVKNIWKILKKNEWIYKDSYSGWYAIQDEAFYSDSELIDGKAPTGSSVEWKNEECYFFKLSLFQDILLTLYNNSNDIVIPFEKSLELISFLKTNKLQDLAISRFKREDSDGNSFYWGIAVPDDENHVIYVWLDALFNYFSANENIWTNDKKNNKICHFIGKEISRFHGIYWPAFLLALKYTSNNLENISIQDIKAEIYDHLYIHGWWTNEGEKISKSLGNVIIPNEEIQWLETLGLTREMSIDCLKYFCISAIPFGNDADYSRVRLSQIINGELINNIINLIHRVLNPLNKNFRDRILNIDAIENILNKSQLDFMQELNFDILLNEIKNKTNNADFYNILRKINQISNEVNKKIDNISTWNLIKNNQADEAFTWLLTFAEIGLKLSISLQAFIPNIAKNMIKNFGFSENISLKNLQNFNLIPRNIIEELIVSCLRIVI